MMIFPNRLYSLIPVPYSLFFSFHVLNLFAGLLYF